MTSSSIEDDSTTHEHSYPKPRFFDKSRSMLQEFRFTASKRRHFFGSSVCLSIGVLIGRKQEWTGEEKDGMCLHQNTQA
jgi:hypothetical protein